MLHIGRDFLLESSHMINFTQQIDLVILDLDGTILDPYQSAEFTPTVIDTVQAVQQLGIPVTIGTGRTFSMVRHYAPQLGITAPVLTTQGAVIGDPVTGEVLSETLLPLTAARKVADWVDQQGRVTVFYITNADGSVTIYQNVPGTEHDLYDHLFGTPRIMAESFASLVAASDAKAPVKFITIDNPDAGDEIVPELTQLFSPNLYITRTHPVLVEGTAQGVDKGSGVRKLCQILGIDPQNVMAVGDSDNDIPMLQAVGLPVAMGNATEGVRAAAKWIAPTIEEDGAAVALEKFILAGGG